MEQTNIIERQSNLLTTEIKIPDDDFLMGFSLEKKIVECYFLIIYSSQQLNLN